MIYNGLTLFADFESYYSSDYSLTRMSPAEYIMDPRFEAICLGVANAADDPPTLIDGPEIPTFVRALQERQHSQPIIMVSHNAQFDMAVMYWRFGFRPDFIIDTIAISRTLVGPLVASHSLSSVAQYFGLPAKGTVVKDVKGMTRADIKACGLWDQLVEYCKHDTWLCREIFHKMLDGISRDELILHDLLTRCTVEPVLCVDRPMLEEHYAEVVESKRQTLDKVAAMGFSKAHLMSNPQFADVLRGFGIEPPMKQSTRTGKQTYAFARQDREFTDLLEHDNIMVRTVVEARLETKSTIEETRAKRFLAISQLGFPHADGTTRENRMPMPVMIGAAHTHRVGGTWDMNVQNLGRKSRLRDALYADDGHTLLVVDSKQIEARFVAWFCEQNDLVEQFRDGTDVYADFATTVFGFPVVRKQHPVEGFVGKTGILQLQYGSGWRKFQGTVRQQTRETPTPIELSDQMAMDVVGKYRNRYSRIRDKWSKCEAALTVMKDMPGPLDAKGMRMGCVMFHKELMVGPTGLPIRFPNLRFIEGEDGERGSWWFDDGNMPRKTYGASLLETISQHCCRCIVLGAAVRLEAPMGRLGARLVHSAHDELVYHVPIAAAEDARMWAQLEMNRPPSWAPDLPLDSEVGIAVRYGDAK